MKKSSSAHEPVEQAESTSMLALLGRMFWMLIGPMGMMLALLGIVTAKGAALTGLDAVYAGIVVLMIGGRWLEQRSGNPTTAAGLPSTPRDFHRYVCILIPLAALAWVAGKVIARLIA